MISFAVFVLDTGSHCFVWIGKDASPGENRNGLTRAHVSFFSRKRRPFLIWKGGEDQLKAVACTTGVIGGAHWAF